MDDSSIPKPGKCMFSLIQNTPVSFFALLNLTLALLLKHYTHHEKPKHLNLHARKSEYISMLAIAFA